MVLSYLICVVEKESKDKQSDVEGMQGYRNICYMVLSKLLIFVF